VCGEAEDGRDAVRKAQLLQPELIATDFSNRNLRINGVLGLIQVLSVVSAWYVHVEECEMVYAMTAGLTVL